MPSGLPSLSRIVIKALEIAGAGLTSALVAYLIGRIGVAPAPTAPAAPAVVQLAPADEEIMRSVRNDQAALLDQLRNDSQARKTPAVIVVPAPHASSPAQAVSPGDASAPSAAAKPATSAPAVARKDQKPERPRAAAIKPRVEPPAEQPLQIQPAITTAAGQRDVAAAPVVAAAPPPESDSKLTSTFKHITAWLLPSRDRTPENVPPGSVPRPPRPVGELWQNEM
jgi:hypothetical protein